MVAVDLFAEEILAAHGALDDLTVDEVVGDGVEVCVVFVLEDVREFDIGDIGAVALEHLDPDEVVADQGQLVADEVVNRGLLVEDDGIGIGILFIALHTELLFGDLSEPEIGFLGRQGYDPQGRDERQEQFLHGGQF